MRKLVFAALLCAAPLSLTPAQAATTLPGSAGVMFIPTYTGPAASVTPVQYRYRHYHHRRYWHRHYR